MKFYLGIFLGAVVTFFWGFLVWGIVFPKTDIMKPLPADSPVVQAIKGNVTSGLYGYPFDDPEIAKLSGDAKKKAEEAADERHIKGPLVTLQVNQGAPRMNREMLLQGFFHMLLSAAILATLTRVLLSWAGFGARYAFIVAAGAFAAVWIDLSAAIWMGSPWAMQLFTAGYDIGAWVLAGLPIAWGTGSDAKV